MNIEAAVIPEEHARAIIFDLEEKEKFGIDLLTMNRKIYLDSWGIDAQNQQYGNYRQFMFLATQLITLYQESQRNSLLPEESLRFGSVAEIKGRRNKKEIAGKIIDKYPKERKSLIRTGTTSYYELMKLSMLVRENAV